MHVKVAVNNPLKHAAVLPNSTFNKPFPIFLPRNQGLKYAVGGACIGGGQGIAVVLENAS